MWWFSRTKQIQNNWQLIRNIERRQFIGIWKQVPVFLPRSIATRAVLVLRPSKSYFDTVPKVRRWLSAKIWWKHTLRVILWTLFSNTETKGVVVNFDQYLVSKLKTFHFYYIYTFTQNDIESLVDIKVYSIYVQNIWYYNSIDRQRKAKKLELFGLAL